MRKEFELYIEMVIKVISNWKIDPVTRVDHRGTITALLHDFQLILRTNSGYVEFRWSPGQSRRIDLHLKRSFADPKAPADKMTRPVIEVKLTVPAYPPLLYASTSRPTA